MEGPPCSPPRTRNATETLKLEKQKRPFQRPLDLLRGLRIWILRGAQSGYYKEQDGKRAAVPESFGQTGSKFDLGKQEMKQSG